MIQENFAYGNNCPKKRVFERFGREQETYDPVGRVHLDPIGTL